MVNFLGVPPPTVMLGLVLAVLLGLVISLAVNVALPTVLRVTLKVFVPETNTALAGNVAVPAEEVMPTLSEMVSTTFQLASTAFTVTLKGVPAACGLGVPVLPETVPGAAASPATSNWSWLNAPALTPKLALTPLLIPLALAVSCLFAPTASISRSVNATTPLPALAPISRVVLPESGPLPALSVTATFKFAGRPTVELFPYWSWLATTGCMPKGNPVLAEPGWV